MKPLFTPLRSLSPMTVYKLPLAQALSSNLSRGVPKLPTRRKFSIVNTVSRSFNIVARNVMCTVSRGGSSRVNPRFFSAAPYRKAASGGQSHQPPSMERLEAHYRYKNRTAAYYTLSVILATLSLAYGSVPLYKMICQTTGWGGQPVRAHGNDSETDQNLADRLKPVTNVPRIRITFNASVSDVLPWRFTPQQQEVRILPGETALAFYTATNRSDKDIIGVATYSVSPAKVAPYFSKIQCFCFEEQRLNAGESVDMPVFFYLDPDMVNDPNLRNVKNVTLSYTFFKAKYDESGNVDIPQPPL